MTIELLWYLIPIIPLGLRGFLSLFYRRTMSDMLSEEERDTDAHRMVLLALMTLSFTGLLALAVVDATLRKNLHIPTYFLLVSFLVYMGALEIQGYKFYRSRDQLSDALMETGTLCLLLSVVRLIWITNAGTAFPVVMTAIAMGGWLVTFLYRLSLSASNLFDLSVAKEAERLNQQCQVQEQAQAKDAINPPGKGDGDNSSAPGGRPDISVVS